MINIILAFFSMKFNPIMQQKIPELADRLVQISMDAVMNAARLRIVYTCRSYVFDNLGSLLPVQGVYRYAEEF